MARALAHIEKIEEVRKHPNADRLDIVRVLGWHCVANLGEFKPGDLCVYFEIDSQVDYTKEPFTFMESKKGKVKTIKLRGELSQGLALALDKFPQDLSKYSIGADVTDLLGVKKIQTQEERRLANDAVDPRISRVKTKYSEFLKSKLGKFIMRHAFTRNLFLRMFGGKKKKRKAWPDFISKTDETRIESIPQMLEQKRALIATEKLDGTSTTFFLKKKGRKYEFGVCSRNVRQLDEKQKTYHDHNIYWDMAFKYDVENVLKGLMKQYNLKNYVVLQGESIGTVQGNPYKLESDDFYAFNLIFDGKKISSIEGDKIMHNWGIKWVPILDYNFHCPDTMEEMKALAEGNSVINPRVKREGCVYRSEDNTISFKNVSNSYLLKHQMEEVDK